MDVDRLIRIAALENTPEVNEQLYQALRRTELYYPVNLSDDDPPRAISIPLLRLSNGQYAVPLYTSKSHPDLPAKFGGASWERVLEIITKMPQADGLILSNSDSDSVAVSKEKVVAILEDQGNDRTVSDRSLQASSRNQDSQPVGELITESRTTHTQDLSNRIKSKLAGIELFFEMQDRPGDASRPTMKTFNVDGIPGVLRLYLSRNRQETGITYAGIRWEALADMVRKEPSIGGVQIVNQSDDWIVFRRETFLN
jgi:hypothetical protein